MRYCDTDGTAKKYLIREGVDLESGVTDWVERIPPSCLEIYSSTDLQRAANFYNKTVNLKVSNNGDDIIKTGRLYRMIKKDNAVEK